MSGSSCPLGTLHCHFIGTIESIMQGNYSQLPIEPFRINEIVIDKCFWPGHNIKCFRPTVVKCMPKVNMDK